MRHCTSSRWVLISRPLLRPFWPAAAASACSRAVRVMASSSGTNAPIVQINTARNGNSEMPGPSCSGFGVGFAK